MPIERVDRPGESQEAIGGGKKNKHTILGPLLEVEMSKKCTPLWREAHSQVSEAQEALLLLPRKEKGYSTSSEALCTAAGSKSL